MQDDLSILEEKLQDPQLHQDLAAIGLHLNTYMLVPSPDQPPGAILYARLGKRAFRTDRRFDDAIQDLIDQTIDQDFNAVRRRLEGSE